MRTPAWCRKRAEQIAPKTAEVLEVNALFRLRAAQGVLGLADKHSSERLEAACAHALAVGDPTYRTIKGILAVGTDRQDAPAPARRAADGGAAAHLRGQAALALAFEDGVLVDPVTGEVSTTTTGARTRRRRGGVMTATHQLEATLRSLKLSGMLDTLQARLIQARAGELGQLEFLQVLCEDEASRRAAAAVIRRMKAARFDEQVSLEEFDFTVSAKPPSRPSATWPHCASWTAASPSSCTARLGSARATSPKPSDIWPAA